MSLDHGTLGTQAYNLVETTRSRSSSAIIVSTSSFAPRVFHRASEAAQGRVSGRARETQNHLILSHFE